MGGFIDTGNDPNSAFGTGFIPISLDASIPVPARTGVGLHSGRLLRGATDARTLGCIRTSDAAMEFFHWERGPDWERGRAGLSY